MTALAPIESHPALDVPLALTGSLARLRATLIEATLARIQRTYLARATELGLPTFTLVLDNGQSHLFGHGQPVFRIVVRNARGLAAIASLDELLFSEAFMAGAIDIEGPLLALFRLRPLLSDRANTLVRPWHVAMRPFLFGQVNSDAAGIAAHYDEDPEFYLRFLGPLRCYSHGIFASCDEPLDAAIARKLDFALASTGAQPGQRVLDIGAGWGAMTEHGGRRGIHMTSLTISRASERFCQRLIADQKLPCRVLREHLLEHRPAERYDAIVNLGVSEHLPDYRATLDRYARILRPGGRVYLDFCSTRRKHDFSAFMYRYIFNGNSGPVCLHEYLAEVARSPFEVVEVHNDRMNYSWTCRHWAQNLELHETEIVNRFGQAWYRRFQLWLWGCVEIFAIDGFGANRLVLQLRD
jgi:cyclopropane-fatty-acyl-phospholipid synthase